MNQYAFFTGSVYELLNSPNTSTYKTDTSCEHFCNDNSLGCGSGRCLINVLQNFSVFDIDILEAVHKIKDNLTMGIDNAPAFLIKVYTHCLLVTVRQLLK